MKQNVLDEMDDIFAYAHDEMEELYRRMQELQSKILDLYMDMRHIYNDIHDRTETKIEGFLKDDSSKD